MGNPWMQVRRKECDIEMGGCNNVALYLHDAAHIVVQPIGLYEWYQDRRSSCCHFMYLVSAELNTNSRSILNSQSAELSSKVHTYNFSVNDRSTLFKSH